MRRRPLTGSSAGVQRCPSPGLPCRALTTKAPRKTKATAGTRLLALTLATQTSASGRLGPAPQPHSARVNSFAHSTLSWCGPRRPSRPPHGRANACPRPLSGTGQVVTALAASPDRSVSRCASEADLAAGGANHLNCSRSVPGWQQRG
ncbi:hypothetical protein OQI_24595 [Streptomyces pharetrae CZA14]|uniref:Uncharacterized protein n=1 Tax=Streptomyces pharetrae CZA14 TaxID=1144883 RepID=A0ABX3YEM2_9ACTN|nr:hypothetical protein OQI_24595 [Streptomyces pharetrae CZA14]